MQIREFAKDAVIIREGDLGESIFKVEDGRVSVRIGYGKDTERELTVLEPGKLFGEMAVLEAWPRSATVVAAEDGTRVLEISSDEVDRFFTEEPEQIRLIMENLSHRLRELTEEYSGLCSTIREMKDTKKSARADKKGLLQRIGNALGIYKAVVGNKDVIEAMEKYEKIEKIHADSDTHADLPESRTCSKGEIIFRQGDAGDAMYFIGAGSVDIFTGYDTADRKLLTTIRENQFFGEMGLIEKLPRSATAVAAENHTILIRVTEKNLDVLFDVEPELILMMLQHLSSRLRTLTRDYIKACRTISEMEEAEEENRELTPEEKAHMNYYIALAKAQTPWMFY